MRSDPPVKRVPTAPNAWHVHAKPGPCSSAGFTLLELLVVLAVLMGLMGLLAGQFDARASRLEALEAQSIEAWLSDAAVAARRDGRERWLRVEAPDRLAMETSESKPKHLSLRKARWVRWQAADSRSPRLRFFGDGSATPGEIRFAFEDRERLLRVDWQAGLGWRDDGS